MGLDVVLDEPAPNTAALAAVLRSQQRQVVAGWLDPDAGAQVRSATHCPCRAAPGGLVARDLGVGTPAGNGAPQPLPLRLLWEVNGATSLLPSLLADPRMPADAVIDWSIDWQPLIRIVSVDELRGSAARRWWWAPMARSMPISRICSQHPVPSARSCRLGGLQRCHPRRPGAGGDGPEPRAAPLAHAPLPARSHGPGRRVGGAAGRCLAEAPAAAALADRHCGVTIPFSLQVAVGPAVADADRLPLAALSTTSLLRRD